MSLVNSRIWHILSARNGNGKRIATVIKTSIIINVETCSSSCVDTIISQCRERKHFNIWLELPHRVDPADWHLSHAINIIQKGKGIVDTIVLTAPTDMEIEDLGQYIPADINFAIYLLPNRDIPSMQTFKSIGRNLKAILCRPGKEPCQEINCPIIYDLRKLSSAEYLEIARRALVSKRWIIAPQQPLILEELELLNVA